MNIHTMQQHKRPAKALSNEIFIIKQRQQKFRPFDTPRPRAVFSILNGRVILAKFMTWPNWGIITGFAVTRLDLLLRKDLHSQSN